MQRKHKPPTHGTVHLGMGTGRKRIITHSYRFDVQVGYGSSWMQCKELHRSLIILYSLKLVYDKDWFPSASGPAGYVAELSTLFPITKNFTPSPLPPPSPRHTISLSSPSNATVQIHCCIDQTRCAIWCRPHEYPNHTPWEAQCCIMCSQIFAVYVAWCVCGNDSCCSRAWEAGRYSLAKCRWSECTVVT
jgi:hypothetical protein